MKKSRVLPTPGNFLKDTKILQTSANIIDQILLFVKSFPKILFPFVHIIARNPSKKQPPRHAHQLYGNSYDYAIRSGPHFGPHLFHTACSFQKSPYLCGFTQVGHIYRRLQIWLSPRLRWECKCQYKNVGFVQYKHVGKTTSLYWIF